MNLIQHTMGYLLVSTCLWLVLTTCNPKAPPSPKPVSTPPEPPVESSLVASLTGHKLNEVSGIAISQRRDGLIWMVNDSGNGARLHALDLPSGKVLKLKVKGAWNLDWEDLTSFNYKGQPYLLIADTGNNKSRRKTVQLYLVKEPDLNFENPKNLKVKPETIVQLTYEDGPLDCESVSFDPNTRNILFMSKRTVPPVLYGLPISELSKTGTRTAMPLTQVSGIPRPQAVIKLLLPKKWKYSAQPTAIDISSDGRFMVVLTYL